MKVKVEGIEKLQKRLKKLGKEVAEDADKVMGYSMRAVEKNAKNNIKGDTGQLKSSADVINKFLDKEVVFRAPHAPYIEFGTKSKVEIPPGLEQYAMQFKGKRSTNMSTEDIKENIYKWARLKGIPEQMWGYIYFTIMKNGIGAQPFLFPAYNREKPRFEKNIKKVVEKKR